MLRSASASSRIESFPTSFQFTLNIDELPYELPDIELGALSWKIIFIKREYHEKKHSNPVLDIYVGATHVFGANHFTKWSCEAEVKLRLLREMKGVQIFEKCIPKRQYTNESPFFAIPEFLEWSELCHQFVKGNKAVFEIEISASPLHYLAPPTEQSFTKMQVFLKNISNLNESCSPEVVLRGVRWTIRTVKEDEELGVYLEGAEEDFDLNWSYEVHAKFKLVSFNLNVKAIEGTFIHAFHSKSSKFGYKQFMNWNSFINEKNEYVKDDTANLIVELRAEEPKLKLISKVNSV